ncbi:MAG: TetR/AcrR family transcriptional regulator [Solirubrobacterales bacterium]
MKRDAREERVWAAALKNFARYGYKKTTIEDIAADLDMSKGNLYVYARDKRNLYEKAVAFGLRRWQKHVLSAMDFSADPVQLFVDISRASIRYLAVDPEMRAIVINDPAVFPLYPRDDPFYEINRESMDALRHILQRGIDEGRFRSVDVEQFTQFMYAVYIMFVHRAYVKNEGSAAEALFESALDLALHGLLAQPTTDF